MNSIGSRERLPVGRNEERRSIRGQFRDSKKQRVTACIRRVPGCSGLAWRLRISDALRRTKL